MPGKMENNYDRATDEEEFNQGIILPPLIIQLKKILDQYPDDTQILKELIQNAEDAGAKEVRFLYDRNNYGQDSRFLHHPELANYQGAALYAYNDGIFSEEDWRGIRMLSQSVKQKDPFKIGYFGMGFKSVFHLTDLPSMISGDKLGIIDPHQRVFSASSHCWNLKKHPDLLGSKPHQFEPYVGTFGCDANSFRSGFFKGTLFRFPLRQKPSPLSSVLYTQDKIQYLLQNFQNDAQFLLLFVRNLERIVIYDRESKSKTNRLMYKAEISDECIDEVRRKRTEFFNQVCSGEWQEKPVVATYKLTINTECVSEKTSEKRVFRFLVTNYYCGGNVSPVFRNLFKDPELGYLPWVGTAMRLDVPDGSDGTDVFRLNEDDGRIFSFLPLPSEQHSSTGLPVHVHGFFALEQNRKYIKWPGSHRFPDIHMDKGLLWNQCMLREALPKCYIIMVMEAIRMHGAGGSAGSARLTLQSVYRAFPDLSKVERKWETILSLVYTEILKYPVVHHTSPGVQEWIEPKNAIFNTLDPADESTSVIMDVLLSSSTKIVNIPDHYLQAIRKYCHFAIGQITATIVATACKDVQYNSSLHWEHKMKLLRYFLKQNKYELLDGLQLLPLANGGFDIFHFNPKKADRPIYISPSEEMQSLLPGLKDDFLESDIDEDIKAMLTKAAMRGYTQLRVLDAGLVGKLLHRCLPSAWLGSSKVEWNPCDFGHPPEAWLESLWLFLVQSSPRDLNSVEGLPIMPSKVTQRTTTTGANRKETQVVTDLIPLSVNNVSVSRTMDGVTLSPDVEETLEAIGIPVVSELPDYVKSHPIVTRLYVFAPTYMGVLRSIEKRCAAEGRDNVVRRILDGTTPAQKRSLRVLFSKISLYEIQRDCLDMLSQLPIFETMEGSGGAESHFASASKVGVAAPADSVPFPVSRLLLDASTPDSQGMAKLLGVKQLNVAQLLGQIVFPDVEQAFYDNAEVQRIMTYVLRHFHMFLDIDKGFRKTLRSLAFLPKGDMLLTPDRFYDPDNELLQKIFMFEENFPGSSYSEPAIVNVLREIGLRGVEDVESEDIQESAYAIQQLFSGGAPKTVPLEKLVEKSNALLEYLHRHKSRLKANGGSLANALVNIRWVRALTAPPTSYPQALPWHTQNGDVFHRPSEMALKQSINLVGSVVPVVAADVYSEVGQAFGWDKPPPLDSVLNHFANVILAYNSRDKAAFAEMARSIYAELMRHGFQTVAELMSTRIPDAWVWTGDGFARPDAVVTAEPFMDLRPFVYGVPAEMLSFADLFEHFGVRESCDLLDVLRLLREKYEEIDVQVTPPLTSSSSFSSSLVRSISKTVKQSPTYADTEVKRDLHICVGVLNELKSRWDENRLNEMREQIFLPVHSDATNTLKLAPLVECTYTDDESMRQGYSSDDLSSLVDEKITLVHANIPNSTSEALGVPTLMSKMLEAEELDYSFGQTDSITNRLSTLLEEYADGFAIPKELVQNADDAGATEVRFLYDERRNEDALTGLIDEGMRECQGPALWVYNNAVFDDRDFENIAKLNGATKENQTDKIGRFGLGFNAVYNVTDVPSFVSRNCIVIFDPHATHLGKSIRNKLKPGLKLDVRRHRKKLRSLGNQFKPFNDVFGCDLRKEESYPATLFRLPLRTRAQAARSEICRKAYDAGEVRELFRMLVDGAENLLLFTQNVLRVGVYHLPKSSASPAEMVEIFQVEKRPIRIVRELGPVVGNVSAATKTLNDEMQRFVKQSSFLRSSSDTTKLIRKGMNIDRNRYPDSSLLLCTETDVSAKGELLLGVAKGRRLQPWYVCNYMGRGESLKMALQDETLVPTAGIAVAVQYLPESKTYRPIALTDPNDGATPHGAVFSYLPLPIRSGLPVHVNGSFSVAANRRYVCEQNEDDKSDPRAIWNDALMRDAVCGAYLRTLNDLAALSSPHDYPFSLLWPNPDAVTPAAVSLMTSFYRALNDRDVLSLVIFNDGLRWGSLSQTVFLDCGYDGPELVGASLAISRQTVASGANKVVACVPEWVKRGLESSDAVQILESRTYDRIQFFEKVLLPNIEVIDKDDRDILVLDSLRRHDDAVNALLKSCRCIPVTPDGTQLSQPTRLVDPTSSVAKLFAPADARFPFGEQTYARRDVLEVLRSLGMKQGARDLAWEEIVERAQVMRKQADQPATVELSSVLLELINEKLGESTTSGGLRQFQQQLIELPFIPAMTKPRNFPLQWKGSEQRKEFLLRPSQLYPPESRDLVGCVQCVADPAVFPRESGDLVNFLRLGMEWKEPTLTQVLDQLDVVSNPDTENYLRDREVADEIQKVVCNIMTFLQQRCTNDAQRQVLREALTGRYFILAHNRFLSPKQVAFAFAHNCAPYLFQLPEFYRNEFGELLSAAGVKENFDVRDYVFALQSLHDVYGSETLDKDSVRLALQLVTLLNERMAELGETTQDVVVRHGPIFIPDARGVLASATELCFNEPEAQWVPKSPSDYAGYSHPLIPYTISKQLGVSTRRQDVLSKHSRGIAFGQKEPLTNRIKRILSGYPCDKEILKELLQNADDAGATEVCFIIDPRQHGVDRVFDHSWRPLQGPALCVYNNRPFTEADLKGIQNLGQGSKAADPNKTGQYGVGFNCVYHLTDVPSFLTKSEKLGETLCVFDPHAKYVPGATVQEPGRRYDDVAQLRKIFTDVFPCYLEDKFDLDEGTMFRFPLRTDKTAHDSELSDEAVSVPVLENLFSKFKQEIFDCLLFVNTVKTISLTRVDPHSGKLVGTYTVRSEMSESDESARCDFATYVRTTSERMQAEKLKITDVPKMEVSYTVRLSDSAGLTERWLVAQRIGVDSGARIQPSVNEAFKSGELALLPRGGAAAALHPEDGSGAAPKRSSKAFCFLPLPVKTDLPVHINGHFCLDHEARRNLWQDDDAGTKTEWNNMILRDVVAPAYVNILRRAPSHLSASMVNANTSVMDSLGEDIPNLETYAGLFPCLAHATPYGYWRNLMEAIYRRIDAQQEIVLPVARSSSSYDALSLSSLSNASHAENQTEVEWHSTGRDDVATRPYFDNLRETFRDNEEHRTNVVTPTTTAMSLNKRTRRSRSNIKRPSHEILRHVLLASGFHLVRLPMEIYESFAAAGVTVGCVTPKSVVDFYASFKSPSTSCLLPCLPTDVAATAFRDDATLKVVLDYCSQDIPYFRSNLSGLPLLLCEDGQLRQFSNCEHVYMSRHHELLPGLGSLFVHRSLVGTVFKDADVDSCDVFRRFDTKALASVLANVMSEGYRGVARKSWDADGAGPDAIPSERWLVNVWSFLADEFEKFAEHQVGTVNEVALARSLFQPLRDWCLLPALALKPTRSGSRSSVSSPRYSVSSDDSSTGDRYLVALRSAETVLDYSQTSVTSNALRRCLAKIGILELDVSLLDGHLSTKRSPVKTLVQTGGNSNLARLVVSTPEQPRDLLMALNHALGGKTDAGGGTTATLTSEECHTVLRYFSDAADSWEEDGQVVTSLRDLRLHLTIDDDVIGLGANRCFLMEDEFPKQDMDVLQRKAGVVFLRPNLTLSRLYSILDCPSMSATDVYLNHIYKNFDVLSPSGRLAHLQFVRDYKLPQLRDVERADFLRGLSQLRFVPGSDGKLHEAGTFYDPNHPVFRAMLRDDQMAFPQAPFDEFAWLDLLRQVGLQKELSAELLVTFAKQIASIARNAPTEETAAQSKTLIVYVFKMKNLPSASILEKLADVPFIPSSRVGATPQKIFPAFGGGPSYIAFKEGVSVGHEVLVWTSAYLLPDWANPYRLTEHDVCSAYQEDDALHVLENYRREIGRQLSVSESPSEELVVEHMQNICSVPVGRSEDAQELRNFMKMDVMNRIYKFLQQKLLESGARDDIQGLLRRLADTPCIVSDVGQTFVKPKQVVINLYEEDQIYPYLHQAPTELGEFKKLFLHLGATLHATAEQYASVLESIYYQTGGEKLHPNEMRLAFKAAYGLFTTLQKHRHKDALVHVHTLFLPTRNGHLFRSIDTIFNDDASFDDRIRHLPRPFLVDLAECKVMAVNYEDVVKLLPNRLRPAMLTSVVQERLEEKSRDSVMLHTTADKLKYQLNSRLFTQGLVRLIKNEHRRTGYKIRQTFLDGIEQNLKKVHVYGVDKLITYLTYEGGERIPGSESDCECFIDKKIDEDSGTEDWSIFINKTTCLNEELQVAVAEGINKMSGGLLKNSIHYIQPILSCLPHSIPKVLDRLKVRPEQPHSSDSVMPTLPIPGSFIPIEDHHLLKEDFEEFETGEYVGYELEDDDSGAPTFIYAVVLERIDEEDFDQPARKPSETSDQQAHRKLTQKYSVNLGDDRRPSIASATDIYKFHRIEGFAPRISVNESFLQSPGGPKKSPRGGYRESFYSRSSVFEPEEGLASRRGTRDSIFSNASRKSQDAFSDNNLFAENATAAHRRRKNFGETDASPNGSRRGSSQQQQEDADGFFSGGDRQEQPYDEDSGYNAGSFQNQQQRPSASQDSRFHPDEQEQFQQQQQPGYEPGQQQQQQQPEGYDQGNEDEVITTEKVMEEVSDTLEEAWKLPEPQRKKIIKRLLLKWHPDKNIGNEAFSTIITQHIQAELERLELGLPRPTHFDPSNFDFDPRNPFAGSSSFQQNFANAYKYFFDQMNQRAKEHKQQRERYQENFKEYGKGDYFGVPPTFSSANPQPAQAKRFLRQAQEDLRAADNDYDVHDPAFEWVCFKAHQAAEKALKAAQFAVDAVTSFSHDLVTLAASLEDVELRRLAQKLQKIVGNSNKLYNPDPIDFVVIPHEEYTKEMACDAVMCSVDILERVKEFVELRDYN